MAFTSSQSEQLVVEQGDGLTPSQGELAVAQGAAVAQPIAYGLQMKRRRPWGAYGLMWLTLGVYHLVWWYKIHNEMNQFDPRQQIKPITSLAAQFFGISTLVSTAAHGGRIARAQRSTGRQASASGGLGLLLFFLLGTHVVYYQSEINKVIDAYKGVPEGERVPLYR